MKEKIIKQKKPPVSPILRKMKLYETRSWDLIRFTVVRTAYQTIALRHGMKFTSKINRADNTIDVTRIA